VILDRQAEMPVVLCRAHADRRAAVAQRVRDEVSDDAVERYPVDERIEVRGNRDLDGGSFVTGDRMDDGVGPLAHG
jgi:hypothetical protein